MTFAETPGDTPLVPMPQDYFPASTEGWFVLPEGKDRGKKLFFYDLTIGEGTPKAIYLFVHGNPESSLTFRKTIRAMEAQTTHCIRIVAVDHIGFGLSDQANFEMVDMHHSENLAQLVRVLDLQDITLAVHDWGGADWHWYLSRHAGSCERTGGNEHDSLSHALYRACVHEISNAGAYALDLCWSHSTGLFVAMGSTNGHVLAGQSPGLFPQAHPQLSVQGIQRRTDGARKALSANVQHKGKCQSLQASCQTNRALGTWLSVQGPPAWGARQSRILSGHPANADPRLGKARNQGARILWIVGPLR